MDLPVDAPVLLIGPGAIGAFVAARLAHGGTPVLVATRTADTQDAIREKGLVAISSDGTRVEARPAEVVTAPEELHATPAWAIIATKCQDAPEALRTWRDVLPPGAPLVAMQNGLIAPELEPLVDGPLVDCVVSFPATLDGPGHSEQTGPGSLEIGPWPPGTPTTAADAVQERLAAVVPTHVHGDIRGVRWTKLVINSCMTTLGVATGSALGDLLPHARARDAFLHITTEGAHVGNAEGIAWEPIQGFTPTRFALPEHAGWWARWWRHQVLKVLAGKHRRARSSSLQSLEKGRRTEVDHLNGVIVATGGRHGIPTPVNGALVDIVHEIEAGKREPRLENLDDLPF